MALTVFLVATARAQGEPPTVDSEKPATGTATTASAGAPAETPELPEPRPRLVPLRPEGALPLPVRNVRPASATGEAGEGVDANDPGDMDRVLTDALQAYHVSDSAEAVRRVTAFMVEQPGATLSPELSLVFAVALIETGEEASAAEFLEACEPRLAVAGDYAAQMRAEALLRAGDRKGALAALHHVTDAYPKSRFALLARFIAASLIADGGDPKAAIDALHELTERYPDHPQTPEALDRLATVARAANDKTAEIAALKRLVVRHPVTGEAVAAEKRLKELTTSGAAKPLTQAEQLTRIEKLIKGWWRGKARKELTDLYSAVKKAKPGEFRDKVVLAWADLLVASGDGDKAEPVYAELAKAAGSKATEAKAKLALAKLVGKKDAAQSNANAEAAARYMAIVNSYGRDETAGEALYMAAWHTGRAGERQKAIGLFDRLVAEFPKHARVTEALWQAAWGRYRLADYAAALVGFDQLARTTGDALLRQQALYFTARTRDRLGDATRARTQYRKALTGFPLTYYSYWALVRLGALTPQPSLPIEERGSRTVEGFGSYPSSGSEEGSSQRDGGEGEQGDGFHPEAIDRTATDPHLLNATLLLRLGFRTDAAAELDFVADGFPPSLDREPLVRYVAAFHEGGNHAAGYRLANKHFARVLAQPPVLDKSVTLPAPDVMALAYPRAFESELRDAVREAGIQAELAWAIMREESAFRPEVRSPANALGLMQMIPPTGQKVAKALGLKHFNPTMLKRPDINTRFGSWYLKHLLENFGGLTVAAIASYNAGPGAVAKWIAENPDAELDEWVEEIPFRETRFYVKKVVRSMGIYALLSTGRLDVITDPKTGALRPTAERKLVSELTF
jgi:soluble lytic murein transglycosylase